MLDGFGKWNFKDSFSQLKKVYRKSLFTKSGVYSCLAFFSFGMMGVAPLLPPAHIASQNDSDRQGHEQVALQTKSVATSEQKDNSSLERCYWQEDVAQFLTLQEKKKDSLQTEAPCKENLTLETPVVAKKPVLPDTELGATIRELTADYPIQVMAPMIAQYDRDVAGLIVGIAKKESNWGKRVPLDASGADCFNYWGYKGAGSRGVAMGHGCFGSPEEAVTAVGNRLKELVAIRETSAPSSMIVWKCGSSCKGHSDESVRKWISDVAIYYNRIATK